MLDSILTRVRNYILHNSSLLLAQHAQHEHDKQLEALRREQHTHDKCKYSTMSRVPTRLWLEVKFGESTDSQVLI